jgi:hypothetical protein
MILQFVVKAFEEESSLLLPEVYDRYKLLLHKNDFNIVIDSDKDMSKLLHFTQLIFNMLKSVLGRTLLCYVPKKKNLGRLIYRNDADVLGSCHSLFLANHRSSNQIALMEKENLKLTNNISSLITDDLKKNTKHKSLEHAAQILRNVIKLYVSDRIKTDRLPDIDNFNCRDEIFKIHPFLWNFLFRFVDKITPFRITRVHFRLFGSLCCSCAFVIFCVLSVDCCWFVSVLPWFIFCPRLLFFYNPLEQWQSRRKNQIARERIFVRNSYPSPCGWMHR